MCSAPPVQLLHPLLEYVLLVRNEIIKNKSNKLKYYDLCLVVLVMYSFCAYQCACKKKRGFKRGFFQVRIYL